MRVSLVFSVLLILVACAGESDDQLTKAAMSNSKISAPAELVSLQEVSIGPPNVRRMWQFKIEYLAPENALVKAGDLIVRFDGQKLRNDLVGRSSNLKAAQKEAEKQALADEQKEQDLVLALAEAKKNNEIAQRKVEITDVSRSQVERKKQQAEYAITREQLKQAQHNLQQHRTHRVVNQQVAQAKVNNARVRVDEIQSSIDKLTILAPKAGMVIYEKDFEDKKPAVGDTVWMGRTLVNLPSVDKIAVKVEFDEADTAKVSEGQVVKVLLDAYPERPFKGRIQALGKAYRAKSQRNLKVVFDAWVTLDELASDIMRPGMKATVQLEDIEA